MKKIAGYFMLILILAIIQFSMFGSLVDTLGHFKYFVLLTMQNTVLLIIIDFYFHKEE